MKMANKNIGGGFMSINRVKKLAGLNESKIKRSDVSRVARDLEALQKMQE